MANKNFGQFTSQTALQTTDHLVGYRSSTSGGEIRTQISNLLNLAGQQPWAIRAWLVGSYRSDADRNNVLGAPRVIAQYNIAAIGRNSSTRFWVQFATPFQSRRYLVLGDAAISNNDRNWVAGNLYRDIPSIDAIGVNTDNKTGTGQNSYKNIEAVKFESTRAAYLTEFYIVFLGGNTANDVAPGTPGLSP